MVSRSQIANIVRSNKILSIEMTGLYDLKRLLAMVPN